MDGWLFQVPGKSQKYDFSLGASSMPGTLKQTVYKWMAGISVVFHVAHCFAAFRSRRRDGGVALSSARCVALKATLLTDVLF